MTIEEFKKALGASVAIPVGSPWDAYHLYVKRQRNLRAARKLGIGIEDGSGDSPEPSKSTLEDDQLPS